MKKFLTLVFGFTIFAMVISIVFMLISSKNQKNDFAGFSPTPTPVFTNPYGSGSSLTNNKGPNPIVASVSPLDGSKNVSVDTRIIIAFNKTVNINDIIFWIGPDVQFSSIIQGKTLSIIPTNPLNTDTIYSFGVKYANGTLSDTYIFSTVGEGAVNNPEYDNFSETTSAFEKQINPDLYLSNQMPYSADTFYANSAYSEEPKHYYFVVFMLGPDQNKSKTDFIDWVKTTGLTDTLIKKLDIQYKENKLNEPD